ncbi:MAG: 1-deoxy-D-xylulose-5-phosphate synthase N-terminal domain-containing protein [Hyphomicrobiaceae bacterium]
MTIQLKVDSPPPAQVQQASEIQILSALECKVLWLSSWMIHHANHIRENRDGLKVGGHQSSCASAASLMTALFFKALRPEDRIAVKPHAAPVFHAIQYLLGRQSLDRLERFRAYGGAQAYPSRTKDADGVDFSTGSVGLGVATTLFASIVQDYLAARQTLMPTGRMVAIMGDAELDEGNVFEALLEGWKHDVRNLWWVIDYNRHSLDGTVNDNLFQKITQFFETVGWRVENLKYGKELTRAFSGPAGEALRRWIDECPNQLYSALTFKGGSAWRARLNRDLAGTTGLAELLDSHDDAGLHRLMTNLGGHDMTTLTQAFEAAGASDAPCCFIAYTIKGYGLPLAGHRDNHAGLMTPAQIAGLKTDWGISDGEEWDRFSGLDIPDEELERFLADVPWREKPLTQARRPAIIKGAIPAPASQKTSTQAAFGSLLAEIAKANDALRHRIVTTSPDVAVSTNLAGFINRLGVFHRTEHTDVFREEHVASPLKWTQGPSGQHIELGIAENNLFLMLAALGLSEPLFGERLLPVGTVYDPFVNRGLDALIYACYQDARFMLAGTPSGIALAPEGGAHQSINTPLVGMTVPGLASFEPAFADELATLIEWGFQHMQRRNGGAVYLRLSTRQIEQPQRRMSSDLSANVTAGGYWLAEPTPDASLAVAYAGAVAPEAIEAHRRLQTTHPGVGLLAITSADRLHADWLEHGPDSHIAGLLARIPARAGLVTVLDGHPAAMSWLGAVAGHPIRPLGVTRFGQSANIPDLFRAYGIDADSIVTAAERLSRPIQP